MEKKTQLVCETCGANLKISEGGGRAVCPYCGKIYDLGQKTEKGKGIYAVLSSLQQRVGIVAYNYGFAEGRAASDSFESDGAEEERALLRAQRSGTAFSCAIAPAIRAKPPACPTR